jgi:two-component system chemotaxis sensor kinase CheA
MALFIIRILLFLSMAVSVYLIVVTLERGRNQKRFNFVYMMVALFLYILGYFIEMTVTESGGGVIAIKVMYLGGCFMSPLFFFFVAEYCEIQLPKKYYRIPMLVISSLNYLLVATFEHHRLIYADYYYNTLNPIDGMHVLPGSLLYYFYQIYSLICIGLSCFILIRAISQKKGQRLALLLLLISALAPLLANFLYILISFIFPVGGIAGVNLTAFVMVISNAILYFIVLRNDLLDLAPKAYAITLDLIRDAFVVLDTKMGYASSNKNALLLFPALAALSKGTSITKLEHWPAELSAAPAGGEKREITFTLPHRENRTYSGWVNPVIAEEGKSALGWVVLIQDITETVGYIRSIQAQRDEIAAMRDNLKEGIFLMDRGFRIEPSYSKALENVLSGAGFQGRSFLDLLGRSFSPRDLEIVKDYFNMIFDQSAEPEMLEEINPLQEFAYTSVETGDIKTLRGLFAPVDRGNGELFILGTFQDITAEVLLKKQLAEEESKRQEEIRSLFELLQVEQKVFTDFIEDTEYEFDRVNDKLRKKEIPPRDLLVEIYQSVHAIKSNSLVVGLRSFGEKFHGLETEIKELRQKDQISFEDILHVTVELEKRMREKDKLLETVNRIQSFRPETGETIKKDEELFVEALTKACDNAAADLNKKTRFEVEAFDSSALLHGQRMVMKEILTQLVRNAVYHGIETPEERSRLGKEKTGRLRLSVTVEGDNIRMSLEDDGRGLDFDKIAAKAEAQGFIKNKDKTNKQLLSNIIFMPGFSTSDTENIHAGRGIGLNLIKDRLKELRGNIKLRSSPGKGTVFNIQIPLSAAG